MDRAAGAVALRHAPDAALPPMPAGKRAFDLTLALLLLVPLSALMVAVALLLWVAQGRPILYPAPRMMSPTRLFTQWKFRTMTCAPEDGGATGAHKTARITRLGRVLRRSRMDELPQLWNVLRGEMSFVGPRPPLPEYVARFPRHYADTLAWRPGVTGLATVVYHRHEDRIMAGCGTAAATHAATFGRCLPAKLRLDTIYRRRRSLGLDLWIVWRTVLAVVLPGGKPGRRRRQANGSAGYPTPSRNRPVGGQTGPQAARFRAARASATRSDGHAPAPTRSSVPTMLRT